MRKESSILNILPWNKPWQIGGAIGLIFGIFLYLLPFNSAPQTIWYNQFFGTFGYDLFCFVFDVKKGPECGWGFLGIGWILLPIVYGSLGTFIGYLIGKVKGK